MTDFERTASAVAIAFPRIGHSGCLVNLLNSFAFPDFFGAPKKSGNAKLFNRLTRHPEWPIRGNAIATADAVRSKSVIARNATRRVPHRSASRGPDRRDSSERRPGRSPAG